MALSHRLPQDSREIVCATEKHVVVIYVNERKPSVADFPSSAKNRQSIHAVRLFRLA